MNHHHDHLHQLDHEGHAVHEASLYSELACHLPYAIFSVAFALIILSILAFLTANIPDQKIVFKSAKMLFHSFHFLHIIFASTGVLITFFRFSRNFIKGLLVGTLSTISFCTLSDSVLPYVGGRILGGNMKFHLCFLYDFQNVVPFLIVGLINGIIMSRHHSSRQSFYSVFSHFTHIFVSALASSFYLVSHGFHDWHRQIGYIFVFLIMAVVVPCTLSDVVVPMAFARNHKKK